MADPKPKRVLVIDDDEAIRDYLRVKLTRAGYLVETALSAKEALTNMVTRVPDVILLDVQMSGMDGLKLLGKLKRAEAGRNVVVIMVTADGDPHTVHAAANSLADGFLVKPFRFEELKQRIQAALKLRNLEKAA